MSMPHIPVDPRVRAEHERRVKEAIERLGERYLCHPNNRIGRVMPNVDLTRRVPSIPPLYVERTGNVIVMSSERAA